MTLKDRAVFWQRTANYFEEQQRQARCAGRSLRYRLEDVRSLVERHLARPLCPYCHGLLTAASFVVGLRTPSQRGGRFSVKNLEVICGDCVVLKGVLDTQEFRELRLLLNGWAKPVRKDFLARLRAGSALVRSKLPPIDSLEWFTDPEPVDPAYRPDPHPCPSPPPEEMS
jgi:hypothetical protein